MVTSNYIIIYTVINVITFIVMGIDKFKAKRSMFRISEKAIISIATIFGALGVYFGMYFFKHKIKKKKFYVMIPILMLIQLLILYFLVIRI